MLATDARMTTRPVGPRDDTLVASLFAASRPDLARLPVGIREPILAMQQQAQLAEYARTHPRARHEVVVVDGIDVGRVVVDTTAHEVRVVDIVIGREHQRRGTATAVLERVVAEADALDLPVTLSAWPDNGPAIALYTRLGFVRVAEDALHVEMQRPTSVREDHA